MQGLEYSEDRLSSQCDAIRFLTYKLSAIRDDLSDQPESTVVLKSQTSFFEMRQGVQLFSTQEIKRELAAMRLLGSCKSYKINITAEIEGKLF